MAPLFSAPAWTTSAAAPTLNMGVWGAKAVYASAEQGGVRAEGGVPPLPPLKRSPQGQYGEVIGESERDARARKLKRLSDFFANRYGIRGYHLGPLFTRLASLGGPTQRGNERRPELSIAPEVLALEKPINEALGRRRVTEQSLAVAWKQVRELFYDRATAEYLDRWAKAYLEFRAAYPQVRAIDDVIRELRKHGLVISSEESDGIISAFRLTELGQKLVEFGEKYHPIFGAKLSEAKLSEG